MPPKKKVVDKGKQSMVKEPLVITPRVLRFRLMIQERSVETRSGDSVEDARQAQLLRPPVMVVMPVAERRPDVGTSKAVEAQADEGVSSQ
ncbi:hypothetical protein ACLOJK_039068 [Asimina triloba]